MYIDTFTFNQNFKFLDFELVVLLIKKMSKKIVPTVH